MATFSYIPDYGAGRTHTPRVRSVRFGDGYEQRLAYGLNTNLQVWQLAFSARTNVETDSIMNFLDARNGVESFDWTTPDNVSGKKWLCRQWQKSMIAFNINSVSCQFEEVAEP